ncbi:hypothetical protein N9C85_01005 [Synechococcus sp. AH-224-I15]|nr:hypothetical protein [Synechococcus sp. AH-224-I15]
MLRAAAPTRKLDEGGCMSSRRQADRYGNKFLDHWFVEAQAKSALPELKALGQILECNAEDWGKEEFASNCLKTALGLSRQAEQVWPGLYQLAALIRERGYFTQDIESWELKKTLHGKETFEEWFTAYIHPSFEAFTRMEDQFKLAEQTNAPLPRTIDLNGLGGNKARNVIAETEGAKAALDYHRENGNSHGGDRKSDNFKVDNINLEKPTKPSGDERLRVLGELEKAADKDPRIDEILAQHDRKEISLHRAAQLAGLRNRKLSVNITEELDDQLREFASGNEMTMREVVEASLRRYFRQSKQIVLEDQPQEPILQVVPTTNGFNVLEDMAATVEPFQNQAAAPEPEPTPEPEPEPVPEVDTSELNEKPLKPKKRRSKCPEGYVGTTEAANALDYHRVSLHGKLQTAKDAGELQCVVYGKNDGLVKATAIVGEHGQPSWWKVERTTPAADPDQPRPRAQPTEADITL